MSTEPRRAEVVAMLAAFGDRTPEQVPEGIDSMELAWLVHQIEEQHGYSGRFDDDTLARMTTVSGVLQVLDELRPEARNEVTADD
ncbi:acyl carrier protein [Streptacidiphilus sp. N1-12]|uniref:Acyl carrier protein n=2 Tax=Streptacidiphilus alkalitolerans TaxID=3342712 RepID=A0ABV6WMY9_9ACTN